MEQTKPSVLEKARAYEARAAAEAKPRPEAGKLSPVFHLLPPTGWMNDPNGFSFYKGQYHLFFQYHPYDANWGPMHWGHASSPDLLHWKHLPAALAPDQPYDKDGCFSGSAITLPDGRHLLVYTGVSPSGGPGTDAPLLQQQCLAFGDGENYEKYAGNPVIKASDLPAEADPFNFRDPKIFRLPDGRYGLVAATQTPEQNGRILLYTSHDALAWRYAGVLADNGGTFGRMWECPDFFELDGKWVLLLSPQDMLPQGDEYGPGNNTAFVWGEFDAEQERFTPEGNHAGDYGLDFYAPQTMLAPDGRRVLIGWMQAWETSRFHPASQRTFGQMTLPRELSFENGRVYQRPVRELLACRRNGREKHLTDFSGAVSFDDIRGCYFDMEVSVRLPKDDLSGKTFTIRLAEQGPLHTALRCDAASETLTLDRTFSGTRLRALNSRSCHVSLENGILTLRVIKDGPCLEVFINDGARVMSAMLPETDAAGIRFEANGGVSVDLRFYDLEA